MKKRRHVTGYLFGLALALAGLASPAVAQTTAPRQNGKIAFTSDRDGNKEIYLMNADGTNQVRITNNAVVDDYPTWSPDGTKIAFVCERPAGGFAICLMNGDGANKTEITPVSSPSTISWSPQGDKITFDEHSDIFVVNIDGSNRHSVTDGPEWDLWPSWSPNGSRILFSRYIYPDPSHVYGGTIMHTIRPDGTDLQELPNGQATDGWNDDYAKWSPSGDQIVFMGNVWDFFLNIFIANADGTNRRLFDGCIFLQPCDDERLDHFNPSWSPDGNWIIYHIANRFQTRVDIFVKNIDGTGFRQLTNTSGRNFNASWQPLLAPSVIDETQFFVRQHYLDFLDREPDPGGLAYWTNEITRCGSDVRCIHERRLGVSAAFFVEMEFQDTGYYVYRFYKASFGRQPNYAEFTSDRNKVIGGSNLEAKKQAFADEWVQRPAFLQAYPITMSNTELVNKLFDTAGLTASIYNPQRQQEILALNAGRSRALVLRDVIEIPDFKNIPDPNGPRYSEVKQISQYNPAFVLMQYFGYLRRNVDQGGYDFWLDVVNNREPNNYHGMVCAFITSTEYQHRFGSVVTRSNADCGQ